MKGAIFMSSKLSKSAEKIQSVLNKFGYELNVLELFGSTRTSQEAADTIGCSVGQIAKSLIFKGKVSNKPILIIASGANRVNEKVIKKYVGEKIQRSDADFVLKETGFAIGGIPPIGHKDNITTLIDEDLTKYEEIWAAAGTPHAVFKLTPQILKDITQGKIISIK
jgi:prolyl-tRNA editing enzyme YbaK/EbsC (Cys-tRNA(Pro) deacylase)